MLRIGANGAAEGAPAARISATHMRRGKTFTGARRDDLNNDFLTKMKRSFRADRDEWPYRADRDE
eukprot:3356814-Pleurochrysis_carterae.AAC.1